MKVESAKLKMKSKHLKKTVFYLAFCILNFALCFSSFCDDLDDAWVYFLNEKYNLAERVVDANLSEGKMSQHIYYLKALILEKRGSFAEAQKYFDKLSLYGGVWSEYALMGRADTYFLGADFKKAETLYASFLSRYPDSDLISDIIYKYGLTLRKEGEWMKAKEYFERIVKSYPNSISSTYARRILAENEFFYTIQVGSFLNYDNAYSLSKKISSLGYDAYIQKLDQKGKLYYRVRVGKYDLNAEAESALKELASAGFSGILYP